jgi:hypothetical protein
MDLIVIFVTYFTVVLTPGHPAITLSESYWNERACLQRLDDMVTLVNAMLAGSGAQFIDGDACATVEESVSVSE